MNKLTEIKEWVEKWNETDDPNNEVTLTELGVRYAEFRDYGISWIRHLIFILEEAQVKLTDRELMLKESLDMLKRLEERYKEEAKKCLVLTDDVNSLNVILEEKDKALQGQHRYFERISVTFGEFECQRLAKEAMDKYTSSNNEGETI